MEVVEENEKCDCFNWLQDMRVIHIGDQGTAKVIRKLRSQSHRRRPKGCAVSGKMKDYNGRVGFLSVCPVRRGEQNAYSGTRANGYETLQPGATWGERENNSGRASRFRRCSLVIYEES